MISFLFVCLFSGRLMTTMNLRSFKSQERLGIRWKNWSYPTCRHKSLFVDLPGICVWVKHAWRDYAFTHMNSTISLLFDPFEKTVGDGGEKKNCLISSPETGRKLLNCKNKQKKKLICEFSTDNHAKRQSVFFSFF